MANFIGSSSLSWSVWMTTNGVEQIRQRAVGASIRYQKSTPQLVRVHPGVYVNHNGPLTWEQRAWCAVLVHWPAALARESALPSPAEDGPIHVAVDRSERSSP
jgi:hypothetical protein